MLAPLRIAHRGMPHLAKENTLPSFALAMESGAQGIEVDVHATRDDILVVHHDPELPSGTRIRETSLSELVREAPELPTLQAVCDLIDGRAQLFVEIKGPGIEEQVERLLERYRGAAAVHSFDHDLIQRLARHGTSRRLGVLVEDVSTDSIALMRRTGATDLWPHHSLVSATLVEAVHLIGGRVIPWTVNAPRDIERVRSLGVDGICTDDVRGLLPAKENRGSASSSEPL
jgi:glycerophosphoryl diester phosphodiesterase